jgi:hypothetical protein
MERKKHIWAKRASDPNEDERKEKMAGKRAHIF